MGKTVLKIENVNSWLLTDDARLRINLSTLLRKRPKNYHMNVAYKKRRWDGWKYFFDPKSGAFLTGILPEIRMALQKWDVDFTITDLRQRVQWQYETIGDDFLNPWLPPGFDNLTLHDYQPDLVNQCMTYDRGIVQAPTGAGKTFILVSALKCLPPKTPTLFLTKNAGLVHQNWVEMQQWGVENLGRWYGDFKEPNYVMCATIHKSTFESLEKLLPKFRALIVDEAHEGVSDVPVSAYKKMTNCGIRLAISATPYKYDKKKIDECHKWTLKSHFGPIFKTTTTEDGLLKTKDLQDRGILAASDARIYVVDKPNVMHEPYQDAVRLGIEQNFHYHEMVAKLAKSCPGRTLIVVERIEQGQYLEQMIPGATFISGKVKIKDRQPTLDALCKGERFVAIVMRQIITAGINVKVHDLINAAGGDAAHNMIQLMGRGLRPASDKDILRYHDFLFLISDYLRKHSEWRMEVLEKEGHKVQVVTDPDFMR